MLGPSQYQPVKATLVSAGLLDDGFPGFWLVYKKYPEQKTVTNPNKTYSWLNKAQIFSTGAGAAGDP